MFKRSSLSANALLNNAIGSFTCILLFYFVDELAIFFLRNQDFYFEIGGFEVFKYSFIFVNLLLYRTYAPFKLKIHFALPGFVFVLYSTMLLVSLFLGEHSHVVYGLIINMNGIISELTIILNRKFLGDNDWVSFALINWIGVTMYMSFILFMCFTFSDNYLFNQKE